MLKSASEVRRSCLNLLKYRQFNDRAKVLELVADDFNFVLLHKLLFSRADQDDSAHQAFFILTNYHLSAQHVLLFHTLSYYIPIMFFHRIFCLFGKHGSSHPLISHRFC